MEKLGDVRSKFMEDGARQDGDLQIIEMACSSINCTETSGQQLSPVIKKRRRFKIITVQNQPEIINPNETKRGNLVSHVINNRKRLKQYKTNKKLQYTRSKIIDSIDVSSITNNDTGDHSESIYDIESIPSQISEDKLDYGIETIDSQNNLDIDGKLLGSSPNHDPKILDETISRLQSSWGFEDTHHEESETTSILQSSCGSEDVHHKKPETASILHSTCFPEDVGDLEATSKVQILYNSEDETTSYLHSSCGLKDIYPETISHSDLPCSSNCKIEEEDFDQTLKSTTTLTMIDGMETRLESPIVKCRINFLKNFQKKDYLCSPILQNRVELISKASPIVEKNIDSEMCNSYLLCSPVIKGNIVLPSTIKSMEDDRLYSPVMECRNKIIGEDFRDPLKGVVDQNDKNSSSTKINGRLSSPVIRSKNQVNTESLARSKNGMPKLEKATYRIDADKNVLEDTDQTFGKRFVKKYDADKWLVSKYNKKCWSLGDGICCGTNGRDMSSEINSQTKSLSNQIGNRKCVSIDTESFDEHKKAEIKLMKSNKDVQGLSSNDFRKSILNKSSSSNVWFKMKNSKTVCDNRIFEERSPCKSVYEIESLPSQKSLNHFEFLKDYKTEPSFGFSHFGSADQQIEDCVDHDDDFDIIEEFTPKEISSGAKSGANLDQINETSIKRSTSLNQEQLENSVPSNEAMLISSANQTQLYSSSLFHENSSSEQFSSNSRGSSNVSSCVSEDQVHVQLPSSSSDQKICCFSNRASTSDVNISSNRKIGYFSNKNSTDSISSSSNQKIGCFSNKKSIGNTSSSSSNHNIYNFSYEQCSGNKTLCDSLNISSSTSVNQVSIQLPKSFSPKNNSNLYDSPSYPSLINTNGLQNISANQQVSIQSTKSSSSGSKISLISSLDSPTISLLQSLDQFAIQLPSSSVSYNYKSSCVESIKRRLSKKKRIELQARAAITKQRSELEIWKHELYLGADVVDQAQTFVVTSIRKEFGTTIAKCLTNGVNCMLLLTKEFSDVQAGVELQVVPPFCTKIIRCEGVECELYYNVIKVTLCTT